MSEINQLNFHEEDLKKDISWIEVPIKRDINIEESKEISKKYETIDLDFGKEESNELLDEIWELKHTQLRNVTIQRIKSLNDNELMKENFNYNFPSEIKEFILQFRPIRVSVYIFQERYTCQSRSKL